MEGIEASLRRFTHYDYWSDKLMPSILVDTKADLLIYGMGEKPLRELLARLGKGEEFKSIKDIPQTSYIDDFTKYKNEERSPNQWLTSHEVCLKDKKKICC